ncbi:MAG: succinate--CoA ligase subunit alpha [Desulfurococcaceae archaeon]
MRVLGLSRATRVLVQGITGREGSFHAKLMLEYGTRIVAGVTPGKGGSSVHGVPVYDSVCEAQEGAGPIEASVIFVPAASAPDAIYEAVDCGVRLAVVITEGIPLHEELRAVRYARSRGVTVVGPNTPGVIVPGEIKLGIMPGDYFAPGRVAVISRSGTLTYEVAWSLSRAGLGVSFALGIGGDPITGVDFAEAYELALRDEATEALVVVGEIGGDAEERFAEIYERSARKLPAVALVAGASAPPERRMGHAGAIIYMGRGDYASKVGALSRAGIRVARRVSEIPSMVAELLGGQAKFKS